MNDDPKIDQAYADGEKRGRLEAYTTVLLLFDLQQVEHDRQFSCIRVLRAKVQQLHDEVEGRTSTSAPVQRAQELVEEPSLAVAKSE